MKGLKIAALCVAAALPFAFATCSATEKDVYEGKYGYEQYGTAYGYTVKVKVKDGVIENVRLEDDGLKRVSDAYEDWTEERRNNYFDNEQKLLNGYKGKSVEEVLGATVAKNGNVPLSSSAAGFVPYPEGLIITGATQSSGRLLLAVQDALSKI